MAPANAIAPPSNQTAIMAHASPINPAMTAGVRKMPPPMTLLTMMAAASSGPRRRWRTEAFTSTLPGEQLPVDSEIAQLHPGRGPVLAEHLDFGVDEQAVVEQLRAWLQARVALRRPHHDRRRSRAGSQPGRVDHAHQGGAPLLGI